MRIVVVGAGLGEVATAAGVHRSGHEVTLYERADRLREAGTAILIAPNGVRALDALGFGDYARSRALRAANHPPRNRPAVTCWRCWLTGTPRCRR